MSNLLKHIIQEIKNESTGADKKLFDASVSRLMGVAMRYVQDEATAHDVIQDAYIRIFKAIEAFDYHTEAETWSWMFRITSREAIRWLRRTKKQERISNHHPTMRNDIAVQIHEDIADKKLILMKCLQENERIAFNLFAIEGYSHLEVAKILEIKESSSRSLVTRARKKLQTQWIKMEENEKQRIS